MVVPVTIQRPTYTTDDYGNRVADWTTPDATDTTGWLTQLELQTLSGENQDRRDTLKSSWRLHLRPTEQIDGFDRVVADGRTFEVEGHPLTARTPAGPHHLEVELRLIE